MPITDPAGNPIPEDDPRIPSDEAIAELAHDADKAALVLSANGLNVDALVTLEAKVDALASVLVPPEGPARRLFEYRVHQKRLAELTKMIRAAQEAKRGPALQVAATVPMEIRNTWAGR